MEQTFFISTKAILKVKSEILILSKQKGDLEYLDFPGGRISNDEKIEAALVREVVEEIGVKIENNKPKFLCYGELPKDFVKGKNRQLILFYLVELNKKPVIRLSIEHVRQSWIESNNLDSNFVVLEPYRKALNIPSN